MASNLDIAALRKLADAVKQAPNRAYRCVAENALSDFIADAECGIVYALLDAAEERDRLATNERMMMGRISGYDECPEDPVAAVMHVADCFDHMTGIVAMVAPDRDRLRAQRDALLTALEPIVWQLESAQRSTAPAFFKGFQMNDTESGALLRSIAAAKETP